MTQDKNCTETTTLLRRILNWSSGYSHEVTDQLPKYYHVTSFAETVRNRLNHMDGRLFAIRGLQGIGKTTLGHWLADNDDEIYMFKWDSSKDVVEDHFQDDEFPNIDYDRLKTLIESKAQLFHPRYVMWDKKAKPPLNRREHNTVEEYMDGSRPPDSQFFELAKRVLSDEEIRKVQDTDFNITDIAHTIIFDFVDYDKNSASQARKDFEKLQRWWEKQRKKEPTLFDEEDNPVRLNILVLWQQEIWTGSHFFHDKFITSDIPKMSVENMCRIYHEEFGDFTPFTVDALIIIARQAGGIMRRFKEYIMKIIEPFVYDNKFVTIDEKMVKEILTVPIIEDKLRTQMHTLFPNSAERRSIGIDILYRLRMGEEILQKDLVEEFDSTHMVSEVCLALEANGLIVRKTLAQNNRLIMLPPNGCSSVVVSEENSGV